MEDVKKLIGDRIRQLRKERGLSQEELGYKSNLHYTHIGAIERGEKNWSIDTLIKVSEGIDVSLSDLLVFPPKPEDIKNMKRTLVEGIDKSSPETLKILFDLINGVKSLETNLTVRKKTSKK